MTDLATMINWLIHQAHPFNIIVNKIDKIDVDLFENSFMNGVGNVIKISALEEFGLDRLLTKIEDSLSENFYHRVQLLVPHTDGRILNDIYTHGCVHSTRNTAYGSEIDVDLPPKWHNMFRRFIVDASTLREDMSMSAL